ncbi:MAG: aminotransferase class V-fold PLP-dependent enzyme [Gemmatimonadetes bacterium]|jgi:selenocysteine lyase/cysteine desulfurase|nr:aminotransferase class V-fold PLP-dependent enzyme [Gemmatimonadota bacterium]
MGKRRLPGPPSRRRSPLQSKKINPPPACSDRQIDPHDHPFWRRVRAQFPLRKDRTYLNTGGLGASPHAVIRAVQDRMNELEETSETGYSLEQWQSIKEAAGRLIGCEPGELAFTRNTTEGANIVCNGLPFERGDELITTTHEHSGNSISWLGRRKRDGIVIRTFQPSTRSAQENLERIERLITLRTRALSIPHITCSTGQIMPVRDIGKLAAERGLWYFVDGAQTIGMMPLQVRDIGCHAYATSGHKWLVGPKGTGLLYVRDDALDLIEPHWIGAFSSTSSFSRNNGELTYASSAQRYEYGTMNAPLIVGLGAAIDFILQIGIDNIWRHNRALADALMVGLNDLGVELLSPQHPDEHSALVTFRLEGQDQREVQNFLGREFKLRTRWVYEGGTEGTRISLHLYNSFADVERVLEGVRAAQRQGIGCSA